MLKTLWRNAASLAKATSSAVRNPIDFLRLMRTMHDRLEGRRYTTSYTDNAALSVASEEYKNNPLWNYFQSHHEGPGIWKWEHYFEIYHRHFQKFINRPVRVLEIGVYSGGSLTMWRKYFGDRCEVIGVDIEPACMVYENDFTTMFIGDQQDRHFWKRFREKVGAVDIVIDDGGHTPLQQQVTLEEILPHLNPGGVYLCEDILGTFNSFSAFASSLVSELNCVDLNPDFISQSRATALQKAVHSMHFYPYALVIEKNSFIREVLSAPRHGTAWQPFFKNTVFPANTDRRK